MISEIQVAGMKTALKWHRIVYNGIL